MNKLTAEEFQTRMQEVQWAREIFINTGFTGDITQAYEAYCKVFDTRHTMLSTAHDGYRPRAVLDGLNRPKCPKCGQGMMLRAVSSISIKTQLVCENQECDTLLNSPDEFQVWVVKMQDADSEVDVSGLEVSSKHSPIPGTKYHYIEARCPQCGGRLYEMEKCCGAPEGLIECDRCDWEMLPSTFYRETRDG